MIPPLEIALDAVSYAPSGFQIYRLVKKGKKIISRNRKETAINLLKISFYEPFLIYDFIQYCRQKIDKKNKLVK